MAETKKDSSVISLMDNPSMPAPWDTNGGGLTFDYGDYICILQARPRTMVEVGLERGVIPKDVGAPMLKHLKDFGMTYHWALFCYWKKGRNPDGFDSARPALVYTVESSKATTRPMLCAFTVSGHSNFGGIDRGNDDKVLIGAMLNALTNGNILSAKKLGGIAVGYKLQTGKEWVENKKGCLLPLVLILGVLAVVGSALARAI